MISTSLQGAPSKSHVFLSNHLARIVANGIVLHKQFPLAEAQSLIQDPPTQGKEEKKTFHTLHEIVQWI